VRGERTAKYNRLLEIEALLGDQAVYPGRDFRTPH
jgi:enolase